jgi:NAD+ kinase
MNLKRVVVVANLQKSESKVLLENLQNSLYKYGIEYFFIPTDFSSLRKFRKKIYKTVKSIKAQLVMVIGGDGTLLSVAGAAFLANIPILGISTGKVGFLTEWHNFEINPLIESILDDRCKISPRLMLRISVKTLQGEEVFYALNDFVINRGVNYLKVIPYEVRLKNGASASFRGDGVIVATPTGSTAYNLSAGGPIVYPEAQDVIITPICSHSLVMRPFIVPSSQQVIIRSNEFEHTIMAADGQYAIYNRNDIEEIKIEKASRFLKILLLEEHDFFKLVFSKLK